MKITTARDWFFANWHNAGLVAALILLALVPILAGAWSLVLLACYLHLPVYMIHQAEEHTGDRFHQSINALFGHGRDVLPTEVIVIANVGLVWIACLVALYLARFVDPGLALIPVYLVLVNAVVHIVAGVAKRAYNPGLVTGVVLFVPLGVWALTVIAPHATTLDHLVALIVAVGGHLVLVAIVIGRLRANQTTSPRLA